MKTLRPALFQIAEATRTEPSFPGFTDGSEWNGSANPWFLVEHVPAVLDYLADEGLIGEWTRDIADGVDQFFIRGGEIDSAFSIAVQAHPELGAACYLGSGTFVWQQGPYISLTTIDPTPTFPRSDEFKRLAVRWEALGTLKNPLTSPEEIANYGEELFRTTEGWAGVAKWLADSAGTEESLLSPAEFAEVHIRDRANYYGHAWVDGFLVILGED